MAHDRSHSRLPAALALGAVAAVIGAAPALASEGPAGPPGTPGLPGAVGPVAIPPLPLPGVTLPARLHRPVIRHARIVPRHPRRGARVRIRMRLSEPGRVRVVIRRRSGAR